MQVATADQTLLLHYDKGRLGMVHERRLRPKGRDGRARRMRRVPSALPRPGPQLGCWSQAEDRLHPFRVFRPDHTVNQPSAFLVYKMSDYNRPTSLSQNQWSQIPCDFKKVI